MLSFAAPEAAAQSFCPPDDFGAVTENDVQYSADAPPPLVLRGPYDIPTSGASMTVRIHVHLLRNSDGTGGMPGPRVGAVLQRMRRDLGERSITLVEAGRSTINNTAWTNNPRDNFSEITATDTHADRIDVYLVGLPAGPCTVPPPRVFGRAGGVPASALVFAYYKQGDESQPFGDGFGMEDDINMGIATHEIGHALGLFHTYHASQEGATIPFDPAPCREFVNGSNGYTCGDYVQSTPADPSDVNAAPPNTYPPYGGWDSTPPPSCTRIRGVPNRDPNGDLYYPGTTNFMTKFNPGCLQSFTGQQGARMIQVTLVQNGAVVQEATVPSNLLVPPGFATAFSAATIRFGQGGALTVQGSLDVSGTTFTAADPAQGWGGIRVAGGQATLGAGATVSGVQSFTGAVTVTNGGTATLDGATIRNTSGGAGLLVSGQSAARGFSGARYSSARITGASYLYDNTAGPGVRAMAGAQVTIDDDDVQIYRNAEGIAAAGTGSGVLVLGGLIRNNFGPGLRASSGGRINVLRDTGTGTGGGPSSFATTAQPVRVWDNIGGLYATSTGKQGGAVVWSGDYVCVQAPCPSIGGHDLERNTPTNAGAVYDALALGGSRVTAPHNYWDGRTSAQVLATSLADKSSSIDVSDALLTPPAAGGGASGRGVAALARTVRDGGASPAAQRLGTGRVDAAVQALLSQADGLVQAGDSTLAATRIAQAYGIVTSDDDRLAVAEAAGRALAVTQPPTLVAWAEALAATPAGRPWGRRALAAGLAGQGRTAEALAVAQALADEDGAGADSTAEAHRARGLGLVVEVAVASGDATLAVQALSDLADVDAEGADELALSVALAFPDATVSYGRSAHGRGTTAAQSRGGTASEDGAGTADAEHGIALVASPNPTAGAVRVALTLGTAGEARVEVLNALGRRVALLHDGPAIGTLTATFDGASVPAGVYVVRAAVRGADGSVSVIVRRVTVAR